MTTWSLAFTIFRLYPAFLARKIQMEKELPCLDWQGVFGICFVVSPSADWLTHEAPVSQPSTVLL